MAVWGVHSLFDEELYNLWCQIYEAVELIVGGCSFGK